MPELTEIWIMSDFINKKSEDKIFTNLFYVEKGNIPIESQFKEFKISSTRNGKELIVNIGDTPIYFFMGMSGNWKYVPTKEWSNTKFIRMRMDDNSGNSLLLYGGYMGPKYSIGKPFKSKRGPDPTQNFELFKKNILDNIENKIFDKCFCEVILDQKYFNGIGNYLRSTLIYYGNINPFLSFREVMNDKIFDLFKNIPIKSYQLNGGQLKDWKNPFDSSFKDFQNWVFYKKGRSCVDGTGRTFWFDPKWVDYCPYEIKKYSIK